MNKNASTNPTFQPTECTENKNDSPNSPYLQM